MASAPETVLVTGASSGIGRALAHRFARAGSRCVLAARSEDELHALSDRLASEYDIEAPVLPVDLSRPEAGRTVKERLQERDIIVDVLVNNAGIGATGSVAELDPEQQLNMVRVNVLALTDLAQRLLPGMLDRGRGGILNVASTAAFQPGPQMSVYYATKAYVLSFSEGLFEEVANSEVTVTCLAPGPTETAFAQKADMEDVALFRLADPMSPSAVAEAGYNGFRQGRALIVPGLLNKLGTLLVGFTPRSIIRKITAWLNT